MKGVIKSLFGTTYKKFKDSLARISDLELRVANLEMAFDTMIANPKWVWSDEVGFNWQKHRKQMFRDLLKVCGFEAILETGTWIGNTTGYLAHVSNLPIYTCELNKRFHSLAKSRLQGMQNITFDLNDSRTFLKILSKSDLTSKNVFIYLDAHWYEGLPLVEEMEIICNGWKNFVIMIDDFRVPGDEGYGYDAAGGGKSISLELIADLMKKYQLDAFFPSVPSGEETGGKRGSVVITRKGAYSDKLNQLKSLKKK